MTKGPGAKWKSPSVLSSLISGARYLMAPMLVGNWPFEITTPSVLYMACPTEPKPMTCSVLVDAGVAAAMAVGFSAEACDGGCGGAESGEKRVGALRLPAAALFYW